MSTRVEHLHKLQSLLRESTGLPKNRLGLRVRVNPILVFTVARPSTDVDDRSL